MRALRMPLLLTRAGMVAERGLRAFWPALSILLLALSALLFGLHDAFASAVVQGAGALVLLALMVALGHGLRVFRWPSRQEALERLDATLPGRPITSLLDRQAVGAGDPASEEIWRAHLERMAERARRARPASPALRLAERDPYALRYVALLAFVMALVFGSAARLSSVTSLVPGTGGAGYAAAASWEGWIEPPAFTGKPSIYLGDVRAGALAVPVGSEVTLRLYGETGLLEVRETVSAASAEGSEETGPARRFRVARSGVIAVEGPGGREWQITALPDAPPAIALSAEPQRRVGGEMRLSFEASDDYGVVSGRAELELDLAATDRRYGLAAEPEPRESIVLDLPMPISGDRRAFTEVLEEDLSQHPWAGLPVRITLFAQDAAGQEGASEPVVATLPGRRFFNPLAAAIAEQRRDLLWNRANATRVARVLRAVSYRPDEIFDSESAYLMLRVAIRRLEAGAAAGPLTDARRDEIARALWDIAVLIEDGRLSDALERLRRAQDRLEQAIRDGASDEEIAELMNDLREAMRDYMQQLAEQAQEQGEDRAENRNMQEITSGQLQQMLDRLQELMEQGRTAEARQLLDQLRRMMENMQVTRGQGGPGRQDPGQQSMQGLADTLRRQQGLNDDTFSQLQEQFSEGGRFGRDRRQEPGQPGGSAPADEEGSGEDQRLEQDGQPGQGQALARRQQALRDQLERQRQGLPGAGTPQGDVAREALERAGRAMEGAEEALRENDFAGALDRQAEAMEALREGMRQLAEQMAQQQGREGRQGDARGQTEGPAGRDPLGRDTGRSGRAGSDEQLLQGEDVYRRARELLDEIRRRSSQQERPKIELEYLRRLLDRF